MTSRDDISLDWEPSQAYYRLNDQKDASKSISESSDTTQYDQQDINHGKYSTFQPERHPSLRSNGFETWPKKSIVIQMIPEPMIFCEASIRSGSPRLEECSVGQTTRTDPWNVTVDGTQDSS